MKTFIITFRKRFWLTTHETKINALTFGGAEAKFHEEEEEDDLIITQIILQNGMD